MENLTTVFYLVAAVIVIDIALLLTIIGLKAVHRHRAVNHARRREEYIGVLSRHLAYDDHTDPITPEMARDPAFLDAVIDVRNTVAGPEIRKLSMISGRLGLVEIQSARLRAKFPVGRRLRAAVSLAEIGDETSAPVLIEHLHDKEPEIRIQAARGLGRINHTPAIDHIVERLEHETVWVRARFADTLIGFGKTAAWPLLYYVTEFHETADPSVVKDVIRVLAAIGDRDVAPWLTDLLDQTNNVEIDIALVSAIGTLASALSIPRLEEALASDDWRIRAQAATALGKIGDPEVIETLATALTDLNWWVRRNSAAALAERPGGTDELYRTLALGDRFARDAAAEALADCGELAKARTAFLEDSADHNHLRLIRYMRGEYIAA